MRSVYPVVFPPGVSAEHRAHTRMEPEELVRRFILNNSYGHAPRIQFAVWGPHFTEAELKQLVKEATGTAALPFGDKPGPQILVRVVYRAPQSFHGPVVPPIFFPSTNTTPPPAPPADEPLVDRDEIFLVVGKLVQPNTLNTSGDQWKTGFRQNLARLFPGINP